MTDTKPLFRNLGLAIKILRELAGFSQAILAEKAGIGKSQLSKYESGKEYPRLDSLEKLLNELAATHFFFFYVVDFLDRLESGSVDGLRLLEGPLGPVASASEEEALTGFVQSLIRLCQAKTEGRLAALTTAGGARRSRQTSED